MPSKIQLDENLVFLYTCLQKSDMKTIDFPAVGLVSNLNPPAARMRYTRLKRQIENGLIGTNSASASWIKAERAAKATVKRKRKGKNDDGAGGGVKDEKVVKGENIKEGNAGGAAVQITAVPVSRNSKMRRHKYKSEDSGEEDVYLIEEPHEWNRKEYEQNQRSFYEDEEDDLPQPYTTAPSQPGQYSQLQSQQTPTTQTLQSTRLHPPAQPPFPPSSQLLSPSQPISQPPSQPTPTTQTPQSNPPPPKTTIKIKTEPGTTTTSSGYDSYDSWSSSTDSDISDNGAGEGASDSEDEKPLAKIRKMRNGGLFSAFAAGAAAAKGDGEKGVVGENGAEKGVDSKSESKGKGEGKDEGEKVVVSEGVVPDGIGYCYE